MSLWGAWWAADGLGLLFLTPVILAWVGGQAEAPPSAKVFSAESLLYLGLLVVAALVAFGGLPFAARLPYPSLIFPVFLLGSIRFHARILTGSMILVAGIAALCVPAWGGTSWAFSSGPLGMLTHLQAFLCTSQLCVLFCSAVVAQQRIAEANLQSLNETLERRVSERTTQLAASLAEKEVLLQEIHHRVKNNLQVVCGLLQLQAGQTNDPTVRALLKESESRVKSMALVHQTLYQSDLANIDFGHYAAKLTSTLFRSYNIDPSRIALTLDAADAKVSADIAVPCGLIINELITNALKYAFPEGGPGEVRVALCREDDGSLALSVSDNGVGFPPGLDFGKGSTLGLKLVFNLVDQLGGVIERRIGAGVSWKIIFNPTK